MRSLPWRKHPRIEPESTPEIEESTMSMKKSSSLGDFGNHFPYWRNGNHWDKLTCKYPRLTDHSYWRLLSVVKNFELFALKHNLPDSLPVRGRATRTKPAHRFNGRAKEPPGQQNCDSQFASP